MPPTDDGARPSARALALLLALAGPSACGAAPPSREVGGALPSAARGGCEAYRDPLAGEPVLDDAMTDEAWPAYAAYHACACGEPARAPTRAPGADPVACGPFPCTPAGCYVARCARDADCRLGLCSDHASGPHGYCVTEDPR